MCFEVFGVSKNKFGKMRVKAENPRGICNVEYGMKISWPVHVQNVKREMRDKFDIQ